MSESPDGVAIGAMFGDQFISPLHDYVMVVPMAWESDSGIILPEQQTSIPARGRVIGVGPGRAPDCLKMTVKIGDVVLYGSSPKIAFRKGSTGFLLMREQEIYAIIREAASVVTGEPTMN